MTDRTDTADLAALAAETARVYERQAARFDAERPKGLHERVWIDRFAGHLPAGGAVLDLGCGAGLPIAAHLIAEGYALTGLDASTAMLGIVRQRFPQNRWIRGDMTALELPDRFDGILGWNSFFHLTPDQQRITLPRIARHLRPGGMTMLTVGPRAGEAAGHVGGEAVYHSSLSPAEYRALLAALGLEVLDFVIEDPECDFQTVLLARKR